MIEITVTGDREIVAKFTEARAHDGISRALHRLGLTLQRNVMRDKLSGDPLKVRTGVLRSSINLDFADRGDAITASVGTKVSYGRYHEYGVGHPWLIQPKSAKALRFEAAGGVVFARRVTHPGLPERSFLRSALRELEPEIVRDISAAAVAPLK